MIDITTLRKYKLYNISIFDCVITLIVVFIVHTLLWKYSLFKDEKRTYVQYIMSLIIITDMFIGIGIINHRIFNIKSNLSKILGV